MSGEGVFLLGELICGTATEGAFATVATVDDVVVLLGSGRSGLVIYLAESSVSLVAPVIGQAVAVACPGGGAGSHIELVSKELGIACVCGAEEVGPPPSRFERVRVTADGEVLRGAAG